MSSENPFDTPAAALKYLGENYDAAKKANISKFPEGLSAKETKVLEQKQRDAVQAHGLALYQWMKDNWAFIHRAVEEYQEDPVGSYMRETAGALGADHNLET